MTARLAAILDGLERQHGTPTPRWPTDAYQFLVWWHCGYPPSDERCAKGWESLHEGTEVSPQALLAVNASRLARMLKAGGIVPELRAQRLKAVAKRVQTEFEGDLGSALKRLPLAESRKVLKSMPGIGDPGADRVLLFARLASIAAVPSNSTQVLSRILTGIVSDKYTKSYRDAQAALDAELPRTFEPRIRAYLLLKCHGERICKRTNPRCESCAVQGACAYFSAARTADSSRPRP